jgi:hypothetical protein
MNIEAVVMEVDTRTDITAEKYAIKHKAPRVSEIAKVMEECENICEGYPQGKKDLMMTAWKNTKEKDGEIHIQTRTVESNV